MKEKSSMKVYHLLVRELNCVDCEKICRVKNVVFSKMCLKNI